jgi:hypothetical protein
MSDSISWPQAKLRERLKSISNSRLLSLETIVTNRLADTERFIRWPALQQSYAQDLKAIHDEMRFREHAAAHKKDIEAAVILVDKLSNQAHNHGR